MKSGEMPSLVIEGYAESHDNGIELLSRRSRRVLWLTVRDGRKVVLKGLKEELRSHPEEVAALRKEYLLGLRIEAEGVVRVYGFEEHPQLGPVIVMEYVDGRPLNEYLASLYEKGNKRAGLAERCKVALEIAKAIATIHGMGISHRDLKPDNILISTKDSHAKIIDFGNGDAEEFVIYKKSVGTDLYGAPEQQLPTDGVGMASDIYSFGKILDDLLPERRYLGLRKDCQAQDPVLRPSMEQVVRKLQKSGRRRIWVTSVAVGVVLCVVSVPIFFYMRNSPGAKPDEKIEETLPVTAYDNPEPSERQSERVPQVKENLRRGETKPEDSQPKEATGNVVHEVLTTNEETMDTVVKKYMREADKINARYGAITFDWELSERNDKLRLQRGDEHFKLADKMERELVSLGMNREQCEKAKHILWTHIIFETNRIDGAEEMREKAMRIYGNSSSTE